jgi:hypothetical protein
VLKDNDRGKARLVAKEFAGRKVANDTRYWASTPSLVACRLALIWCAMKNFVPTVTDISGSFLTAAWGHHGRYAIAPLPEYWQSGIPSGLKKALYGLREAPQYWQEDLGQFLVDLRCQQTIDDKSVYILKGKKGETIMTVVAHVDDLLIGVSMSDKL